MGHPSMEELHLDHNGIGMDGATGLLGAMQMTEDSRKGRGLRRVWLHGKRRRFGRTQREGARHSREKTRGAAGERPEQIPRDDLTALEAWEDDAALEAEGEAAAAGGGSLPGGFKETSTLFANRVAAAAAAAYRRWFPDHAANTRGAAVIAAIVAHERDAFAVRRAGSRRSPASAVARLGDKVYAKGGGRRRRGGCAAVGERRARQPRRGPRASRVPAHVLPRDPGHRA